MRMGEATEPRGEAGRVILPLASPSRTAVRRVCTGYDGHDDHDDHDGDLPRRSLSATSYEGDDPCGRPM